MRPPRHALPPDAVHGFPRPDVAAELLYTVRALRRRLAGADLWAVTYWSMYRAREPLVDALRTTWQDHPAHQLLQLTPDQLRSCEALFRATDRFRAWVSHTEAMPGELSVRLEHAVQRLTALCDLAEHHLLTP